MKKPEDIRDHQTDPKSYTQWKPYTATISLVYRSDGRTWSAYDEASDMTSDDYATESELVAALESGAVFWN